MPQSSRDETRACLARILDESVRCARGLQTILEDERAALEQQDSEALLVVASTKAEQIEALTQLESRRSAMSVAAGFGDAPQFMGELTRWCDNDSQLGDSWTELTELAARCRLLNSTNGAIIRVRRQHIASNLAVIRGSNAQIDTYGPQGSEVNNHGQNRLADA